MVIVTIGLDILQVPFLFDSFNISVAVAPRESLALVVQLFALCQTQFQLDAPVGVEIDGEGDEGEPLLLYLAVETHDLPLVHEETLWTHGVAVEDVALLIGAYMHAVGEYLAVLDDAERILQVYVAHPDGFDLCPEELDTGLETVEYKVVVERLPVVRNCLDRPVFRQRYHLRVQRFAALAGRRVGQQVFLNNYSMNVNNGRGKAGGRTDCRFVGLSMMCYTLGKEKRTCLGDCQSRGRMGKLLYSLFHLESCLVKSSKEKNL